MSEESLTISDSVSPEAWFLSRWTYSWMDRVFLMGYRKPLQMKDMWSLGPKRQVQVLTERLENGWIGVKDTSKSLVQVAYNVLFWELFPIGFLRLFSSMCSIFSPFLIKLLVQYVQDSKSLAEPPALWIGFAYAVALFFLQLLTTLTENYYFQLAMVSGMSIRAALTSMIYKKATRLSSASRQKFNSGNVTNLVSTDVARLEQFISFMHVMWVAPIQIIVITAFLIVQIGPAALAGIGLLILLGPMQLSIMKKLGMVRKSIAPLTDKRVKLTQEVLSGIRVIKFFAWEKPFLNLLETIRENEIGQVLRRSKLNAVVVTIAFAIPTLSASVAFAIYGATHPLDPGAIFAALTWFQLLRFPLMFLPNLMVGLADVLVALKRIQDLLLAPELDEQPEIVVDEKIAVRLESADFVWDSLPPDVKVVKVEKPSILSKFNKKQVEIPKPELNPEITLTDIPKKTEPGKLSGINLEIQKGSLVAIVGAVGSGKSSLLQAIVGEMKKTSGKVSLSGSTGYAPQQAWIQNATVKENILFGLPYDETKYLNAIRDCALEKDLEILPDGDKTQIGERGINLSGGQKQRVNLSRLVYFDADIVLLDDPLSAVDSHVGRYLFEQTICGALNAKTRLLVTHQLHVLPKVDFIIVMKNGHVEETGTFAELMAKETEFATLMRAYGGVEEKNDKEEKEDEKDVVRLDQTITLQTTVKETHKLIQNEERAVGTVEGKGGITFLVSLILIAFITQGAGVGSNFWLVLWTNHTLTLTDRDYIIVFLMLGVAQAIFTYFFGLFFAYAGTKATKQVHRSAMQNIIRAPARFFDQTPLGRIINRFSKDQDAMDTTLMDSFRMFAITLSGAISIFILLIYATPWFAVPLVPVMGVYYTVQLFYRSSSRELKRMDSLSRSPLYAQIGETLTGLPTIRAYRDVPRFINSNNQMINSNLAPYFLLLTAARWLSLRLETLGALLVFFSAMFGILSRNNPGFSAALLGLSLSYSLQVTGTLNWCVRQFTDTEIAMNAVERLHNYGHVVKQEAPALVEDKRPPQGWPTKGDILFENVEMRYAPDLPLVLKGVSFTIRDKEKIGIVGRTGSGKSSLMQALFRMVEPAGKISIDGLNTLEMGLEDLRSGLGIIPQDPILFSGTFRRNLDPFGTFTDQELWDAVERANIKTRVSESEGGLDGAVQEGGENLSVGERQLLCLARAMVRKPRIIIMDEATANVDYETDAIIQTCLRKDFSEATILTIAHRLNTILDYDRVMVMQDGLIVEFDSPKALLSRESVFRSMVQETGQQNFELFLKTLDVKT